MVMGYLAGKLLYLSGPIEHGCAENWRDYPKKVLTEEFGLDVFDPFADIKQQWVPALKAAQEVEDYETMESIAQDFVQKDLTIVDQSHIVIAYLPYKVPTTGTCHEIINSSNAKKPTLLMCPQGKKYVPIWYRGWIKNKFTFGAWDEVFNFLREVEAGLHKDNRRFRFIYGLI